MTVCEVRLWGSAIGAVTWDPAAGVANFAYTDEFQESGIQVAPLMMPLGPEVFRFPELARTSFHGLPGLVADSLPDRFGNAVFEAWLTSRGRKANDLNPVERLSYTGVRGMGALEFWPALETGAPAAARIELEALVELSSAVLRQREAFQARLAHNEDEQALASLLSVGTSAGGARAKAVVAWNPVTGELRSGQTDTPEGFEHWLIKFDGVSANRDKELADPEGYGLIEYAYSKLARAAGITMSECRILEEHGRHHFMTRRFDRVPREALADPSKEVARHAASGNTSELQAESTRDAKERGHHEPQRRRSSPVQGVSERDPQASQQKTTLQAFEKLHLASLGGLTHRDYNQAGAHSYEGAFDACGALGLPMASREQLFRRMLFNVFARNQDDHVKNIAFLMDKRGTWSLSPAFDLAFAHNPSGAWTHQHQMTIQGKRDHFEAADFDAVAKYAGLARGRSQTLRAEVHAAVATWPEVAAEAGVPADWAAEIARAHRQP